MYIPGTYIIFSFVINKAVHLALPLLCISAGNWLFLAVSSRGKFLYSFSRSEFLFQVQNKNKNRKTQKKKKKRTLFSLLGSFPPLFFIPPPKRTSCVFHAEERRKSERLASVPRSPTLAGGGVAVVVAVVVAAECKEASVTAATRSRRMFMEIRHFSLWLLRNEVL